MTIKEYVVAESIEQAYELNQKKSAQILGGMGWIRLCNPNISTAIDLSALGLDCIEENENEFRIGAMVTLRMLEKHAGLLNYTNGAVKDAVKHIVGTQFRNTVTVGGSLFGRFGFSDVLTLFLALDCEVELVGAGRISLNEFSQKKYDRDVLTHLILRKKEERICYEQMRAQSNDFPILAVAVCKSAGEYRVSIGARPMKAMLVTYPAGMRAEEIAGCVKEDFRFESNQRGSKEYRKALSEVLTLRAIERIEEEHEN